MAIYRQAQQEHARIARKFKEVAKGMQGELRPVAAH